MKKEIKMYGNSAVITLTKEDLKLEELNVGDIVEISIVKKVDNPEKSSKIMGRK